MPLAAGTRLGPYELVALLGVGGMGEVYRARDPRLGREVAVKVLSGDVVTDAERLRRFETEARAASALNHPVLVTVLDTGRHDGAPYVVFELLEGQTLRERLERGALPLHKAIEVAEQIARGLAAAHDKGILHRDLKPENLFLTKDGRVKILDFGLARLRPELAGAGEGITASGITDAGVTMGTVGYMSPEQVLGQPVDHRSDIFSFGVVLYEMLAGRRAFRGASAVETMNAILKEQPPELTGSGQEPPAGLARLLRRCLDKSPAARFHSGHDLAFALEDISRSAEAPADAGTRPWLGRSIVAALALALPFLGYLGYLGGRAGREPLVPSFQRLTYGRGAVGTARFTPDGKTVIYGASWNGNPFRLFSTRVESPESAALRLPDANLLSVSPTGELAVSVGRSSTSISYERATLATVPLAGEALHERLHDVWQADWSADGQLAVIREVAGRLRLEFPPGKVLHEAPALASLYGVRVSPDGRRIAVATSTPAYGMGPTAVMIFDHDGVSTTLWEGGVCCAWSPRGDEIWYAIDGDVKAMDLNGRRRVVARLPAEVHVTDISKDGRMLLVIDDAERGMAAFRAGDVEEREITLFGHSQVQGLSADGRTILFSTETGQDWTAYVQRIDGAAPASKLGAGFAQALSLDGAWAILEEPANRLVLVPTGAGDRRPLETPGLKCAEPVRFLPDARQALATCVAEGRAPRAYLLDFEGGKPRPLTPEGTTCSAVSSQEAACTGSDSRSAWLAYPFDGASPRAIPGVEPDRDYVIQWTADGRSVFVRERGKLPQPVYRLDVASGHRQPWKKIMWRDPVGVRGLFVEITPDGNSYAYSYDRSRSTLWLVDGLVH